MTKISISEAIKMSGVSRSHFYNKYVNQGIISLIVEGNKKLIDVSELIRVFGSVQLENNHNGHIRTTEDTSNTIEKDKIIDILEQQIVEFKNRERETKEREEWLQSQIDELRQQHTNLLENKLKIRKKFLGIF
jgi:hypothetical protein